MFSILAHLSCLLMPHLALGGRLQDKNVTKFAQALQAATPQDIGGGMMLLTFSSDCYFPDDPHKRRNQLLVRDFYPTLLERMSSENTGQSLLTGVPGTGKSWW